MAPIASRRFGKRSGWTRALFGVVIVGALVVALALAQRGILQFAPRDIAEPLPPLTSKVDQVYRGPIFVQPVPVRVVQTSMATEAAIKTATAKSRPKPSSTTDKSKHKSTEHLVAESNPEALTPHAETCDGMGGMDLARCMRPQILDADQQLRTAYNDAFRAGVERRELVAYRRQWSKLRKRANSDPRNVLVGYREIAQKLDAARAGRSAEESECQLSEGVCAVPHDR
jgi:uncharacterized protein YecT (DUF1311 family)